MASGHYKDLRDHPASAAWFEEWRNFFLYYRGTHQQEAIEMLRQFINEADPSLLTQTSAWVERWPGRANPRDKTYVSHSQLAQVWGCAMSLIQPVEVAELNKCLERLTSLRPAHSAFLSGLRMSQAVGAIKKSWLLGGIMRGDLTSAIQNLVTDHGLRVLGTFSSLVGLTMRLLLISSILLLWKV